MLNKLTFYKNIYIYHTINQNFYSSFFIRYIILKFLFLIFCYFFSLDLDSLWIKDEGFLPTGTFKARGAAVGVSKAKELNIKTIALPSNGNAGASWCAYSAR